MTTPTRQDARPPVNFTGLWIAWIVAFIVIEAVAIFNDEAGDTFSENIWAWFRVLEQSPTARLLHFVLLALMAWLTVHFLTGGRFV